MLSSFTRCFPFAAVTALWLFSMPPANAGFFDELAESADKLRQTAEDISQFGKNGDTKPVPKTAPEDKMEESSETKPPSVNSTNAPAYFANYNKSPSHVASAQQMLNQLGYNVGQTDGIYGRNTEKGIRAYQMDKGLSVDGNVTAELLGYLSQDRRQILGRDSSATQDLKNQNHERKNIPVKNQQTSQAAVSSKNFPPELVFDRPTHDKSCIELHSICRDSVLNKLKNQEINSIQFKKWGEICDQQTRDCTEFKNNKNSSEPEPLISRYIADQIEQCRYGTSSTARRFDCDCIERKYKKIHSGKPKNQEYDDYTNALAQCVDPIKTYNYAYESCMGSADLILNQQPNGDKASKNEFCECTAVEYQSGLISAANTPSSNVGDSQLSRRILTSSFERCL